MADDWAVKEVMEPRTGVVRRYYTYRRRPCKRVVLKSRLAEQMAGYVLIEKDLRSVGIWLSEIAKRHTDGPTREDEAHKHGVDREKYNLIKGLFAAALTFYGKCFSKCEGRPVKLERVHIEEQYRDTHDECISFRHNFAAHSGAAKLEHVEIALVFPIKGKVVPRLYRELWQPDLAWASSDEVSFMELVEHARAIANAKIHRLHDKILQEEVLPKSREYWSRK